MWPWAPIGDAENRRRCSGAMGRMGAEIRVMSARRTDAVIPSVNGIVL